jgi:hypothetical protein
MENDPIVTRGAPLRTHGRLDGSWTMRSHLLFIAASSLGLAIVAIASLQNITAPSSMALEAMEESSVQLFKNALASQQEDLARHREKANKMKEYAMKSGTLVDGFHSKTERLSDAKLFKDAVKEQHDELAKQRAAESTARAIAKKTGGSASILPVLVKSHDSDASLLKDAIKEQHAETKSVRNLFNTLRKEVLSVIIGEESKTPKHKQWWSINC